MKKILYILLLIVSTLLAQPDPSYILRPIGADFTTKPWWKVGFNSGWILWDTTYHDYYSIYKHGLITDTTIMGFNPYRKYTFKNIVEFDSTVYAVLKNNTYLGSKTFVSGWAGSGWRIDKGMYDSTGLVSMTIDNLEVRHRMNVFELTIQQINGSNGPVLFTSAGKISWVNNNPSLPQGSVRFEDPTSSGLCPFQVNDLIVAQRFNPHGVSINYVTATVTSVNGTEIGVTYNSGQFNVGDAVVRVGNNTDPTRQNSIFVEPEGSNSPYMDIIQGVASFSDWGSFSKTKARLGNLTGITDPDFGTLTGSGLYANNAYLTNSYFKGVIKFTNKQEIADSLQFNVTIYYGSAPTTRLDGTSLQVGDTWVSLYENYKHYRWDGSQWLPASDYSVVPNYSEGTTFPLFPAKNDWFFYTGAEGTYHKNTWYQWTGSAWINQGLTGTYIDGSGVYTGLVVADRILSGKIHSYIIDADSVRAGTFTGLTFRTAASGQRVVLNNSTNDINLYDPSNHLQISISGGASGPWNIPAIAINEGTASFSKTSNDGIPALTALFSSNDAQVHQGISGISNGAGTGPNYGVQGTAFGSSTSNAGVYGLSTGTGPSNVGVLGVANGAGTINYGVYGQATGAGTNWAGYFNGDVSMGTIKAGTWNGTAIGDSYISSAATWNAKSDAHFTSAGGATYTDVSGYVDLTINGVTYHCLTK
jgi:hypothetical protein